MARRNGKRDTDVEALAVEHVAIAALVPHPSNYRYHPDEQLDHLRASLREHGFYRNVVIARDGTILAGHGVVEAARAEGFATVPVRRMPFDANDPRALKLLVADNTLQHFAADDDRALSELLKLIRDDDATGLLGTGFDDMMLANLAMVTRPASEIRDFDEASAWVGMPEYERDEADVVRSNVSISFRNDADRDAFFANVLGVPPTRSLWWPPRTEGDDDVSSLLLEDDDA